MGQASPQPMVMTMSAAWTWSVVRRLGISREMSRPISAIAATTAGLSSAAGCEPADVTRIRPAAWWSRMAAAICERPALWVQTNSTSGTSGMVGPFVYWTGRVVRGRLCAARDGDLGCRGRCDTGVEALDDGDGQAAADELGGEEGRRGCRRDAGEGVGEDPADGDGRVGEAGRGGEEVGRADVGADRGWGGAAAAGSRQREDDQQQAEGGDDLGQEMRWCRPVLGGDADRG